MVSDMAYYCRIQGEKEWERFDEHPCRSLKGVARSYAKSRVARVTVEVRRSLESPIEEFVVDSKMTEGELFKMLEKTIDEYRLGANDSLRRNSHMNANVMEGREDIPQEVLDALLVDFVNYFGARRGGDYGLYTKHLRKRQRKL